MAEPAARRLPGRDRDAHAHPAGNGRHAVRGPWQRDHRPRGRSAAPHPGAATELIDVLVPASRKRRDAAFVRLHRTTRMPERTWQARPAALRPARAGRRRCRARPDQPARRAGDGGRRRAARPLHRPGPVDRTHHGPERGSTLFREALTDVADGIRSAAEGDLKDLLAKSGLPMPLFNASIYDGDGTFIARPDAWWPEKGVAVEVDSHEWHLSPHDHTRTLERQRRMGKRGILVAAVHAPRDPHPARRSHRRHPATPSKSGRRPPRRTLRTEPKRRREAA